MRRQRMRSNKRRAPLKHQRQRRRWHRNGVVDTATSKWRARTRGTRQPNVSYIVRARATYLHLRSRARCYIHIHYSTSLSTLLLPLYLCTCALLAARAFLNVDIVILIYVVAYAAPYLCHIIIPRGILRIVIGAVRMDATAHAYSVSDMILHRLNRLRQSYRRCAWHTRTRMLSFARSTSRTAYVVACFARQPFITYDARCSAARSYLLSAARRISTRESV